MSNIHEYMKLRQYFINMTMHADPAQPLPSERTLAEMFSVARKTVRHALDDMVNAHYLIKRARRGYFVNPLSMQDHEREMKIIGLLYRGGNHAFYGYEDSCFLEHFFREIRNYKACGQLIMVTGPDMIYNDIANSRLDGLIWIGLQKPYLPIFEKIEEEKLLPQVALFESIEPVKGNYIYLNLSRETYQKTKHLLECGCRNVVLIKPSGKMMTEGYRKALDEFGIPFRPELCQEPENYLKNLPALLEKYHVDGIVSRMEEPDRIREFAGERGIRIPEELQIISGDCQYDWKPTVTVKPFRKIMYMLLRQLWDIIEGKNTSMQEQNIQWEIEEGSSTRHKEEI